MTVKTFRGKVPDYIQELTDSEMSQNTKRKYLQAIKNFISFAEESYLCEPLHKNLFLQYKEYLSQKYKPSTCNLYIIAVNGYLRFLGGGEMCVKTLKIHSRNSLENCLTIDEYGRMLEIASKKKNNTAYYVMRALASTGIRISTLEHFTVENVRQGVCTTTNKGKTRNVVIPAGVCSELMDYCNRRGITTGRIFCARDPEKAINEPTVLRWLKAIASEAGIDTKKAFPHNLRHLFAKRFMDVHNDLGELADLLGHTKIETTRIYTRTSIEEKRRNLELLGL